MRESRVRSLCWEDLLEKETATHSSILAWRIPWTEEHGGLQSMGVAKSWTRLSDFTFALVSMVAQTVKNLPALQETWIWSLGWENPLEKEMATHPVFLSGEFHGQKSLVGNSPRGSQKVEHNWTTFTFFGIYQISFYYFNQSSVSSVAQSCPTLWDPMDCSLPPGFPVHHQFPELAQTHVRGVGDAIQPSPPLLSPSPPDSNLPASGSFLMRQFFASGGQSSGDWLQASVLQMNIHDWFPLGWTGWISLQSKGLLRAFSNSTVQKHQFFGAQLYSPTLTSIHDYWKNISFD